MTQYINTQEAQNILLDIAKEFHKICQKHNIPYYMIGGTMLGAIRHKGFIPWDDDMDFGIPREHYNRFIQIALKELPNFYKLHTIDNSAYALMGISKIADTRTEIHEKFSPRTNDSIGLNIDIFPIDQTNDQTGIFSRNRIIQELLKLQRTLFIDYKSRTGSKRIIAYILQKLIRISPQSNIKRINKLIAKSSTSSTHNMWVNFYGTYGFKEILDRKLFGEPILYPFENTHFYGVAHYDAYLKHFFSNYMELPPIDKRHIHHEKIKLLY